jgi:hypothetical protein
LAYLALRGFHPSPSRRWMAKDGVHICTRCDTYIAYLRFRALYYYASIFVIDDDDFFTHCSFYKTRRKKYSNCVSCTWRSS